MSDRCDRRLWGGGREVSGWLSSGAVAALWGLVVGLAQAQAPSWWARRGVVVSHAPPNDYAPANVGQAKWMAAKAAEEFEAMLGPLGGMGPEISNRVAALSGGSNDYAPLNVGQLKYLTAVFYERLEQLKGGAPYLTNAYPAGVQGPCPWTEDTGDDSDWAPANVGQLKYVFAFEFDRDGDGLADWWEVRHGLNPQAPDDADGDRDGDGLRNLVEFQSGTDPNNSDSDGDGLPDGWEVWSGFNPTDPADAAADPDRDGRPTLQEYHHGSNPRLYEAVGLSWRSKEVNYERRGIRAYDNSDRWFSVEIESWWDYAGPPPQYGSIGDGMRTVRVDRLTGVAIANGTELPSAPGYGVYFEAPPPQTATLRLGTADVWERFWGGYEFGSDSGGDYSSQLGTVGYKSELLEEYTFEAFWTTSAVRLAAEPVTSPRGWWSNAGDEPEEVARVRMHGSNQLTAVKAEYRIVVATSSVPQRVGWVVIWEPEGRPSNRTVEVRSCEIPAGETESAPFFLNPLTNAPGSTGRFLLHLLCVDLDGDTDRNGVIDDQDEEGEDATTRERGILITPPLRELQAQGNNIEGLARIRLSALVQAPVAGLTYHLRRVQQPPTVMLHLIDLDGKKLQDKPQDEAHELIWDGTPLELAVMPRYARPQNPQTAPLQFVLDLEARDGANNILQSDRVRLSVAPLIIPPECNKPYRLYTSSVEGIPGTIYTGADAASPWAQDMVKFAAYQIASNAVAHVFVDLGHETGGDFADKLRRLGNPGTKMWAYNMNGDGGNIMATPPLPGAPFGKLMIGSSRPDVVPYWTAQGVQPVIEIATHWLLVGHVDEIFMWVASNKVLYADPWKAADLMHQEIVAGRGNGTLWYGFTPEGKNNTILSVAVAPRPGGAGRKLATLPAPELPNNEQPATLTFAEPIFEVGDFLRVDDEILKVTAVDGATVTVARAQAGRPAAQHEAGSVVYALSPLLVDNLPTYGAATERVVGKIAQSLKDLRDGLGAHANQVTFIPMPVLFEKPLNMNGYSAVTANVVNGVLFANGPFLYPSTGSGAFHNYILTKLPAAIAYEHHWEFLHCAPEGGGGLHCATAARRELKPEKAWWEMLNDWE